MFERTNEEWQVRAFPCPDIPSGPPHCRGCVVTLNSDTQHSVGLL